MSKIKRSNNQKGVKKKSSENNINTFSSKSGFIILALIIIITFIAFRAVLKNGFVWDDRVYIIDNDLIKNLSGEGLKSIFTNFANDNYSPITDLINAIQFKISGMSSFAFHFGSLLFHLINIVLVFLFIRELNGRLEIALIATLLFGIHPVNVESVAWISSGSNLFSCTFFLISLISYLYYLRGNKLNLLILSITFFILSVLSKAVVIFLPFILFLIDYLKGRKLTQRLILEKIPFLIISFIVIILSVSLKGQFGSIEHLKEFTLFQRIVFAGYGFVTYLVKLVIPYKLSAYYPYPVNEGVNIQAIYYLYLLFSIGLFVLTIFSHRFTKKIVFGLGFYAILIVIVLQLIPLGNTVMADRYFYIPSIGIFYLLGVGIFNIWKKKSRFVAIVLLSIFSIFFFIETSERCKVWENGKTLWDDVLKNYQTDALPYYNRGVTLMNEENTDQALIDFNKAIELEPEYTEAYVNRGIILRDNNRTSEALSDFNKALILKPNFEKVYFNRGNLLKNENRIDEALKDYNAAININPDYIEAFYNRGNLYRDANNFDKALDDYSTVIKLNSKYIDAYINRGGILFMKKKYAEAINDYSVALEINPNYALVIYNRGLAKYYMGNKEAACADLKLSASLGYKPATDALQQFCK
ncbi:MAG: tetratricopeptide repeat protein [Prolixibacteraceae bacterium]|nr:tetratricopeptide repeat protein [Prolixibacteraceae bacterium]